MTAPRANIYAVAERAGVSIATVSRVQRGVGPVSTETRERVEQAIDELGYSPSPTGRALAGQRLDAMGIVFPDLAGPYYSAVLLGAEAASVAAGSSLLILATHGRPQAADLVRELSSRVDGLVVMGRTVDDESVRALAARVPLVLLARGPVTGSRRCAARTASRRAGSRRTSSRSTGTTRLSFIGDPGSSPDAEDRWQGFQDASRALDVPAPPAAFAASIDEQGGRKAAGAALRPRFADRAGVRLGRGRAWARITPSANGACAPARTSPSPGGTTSSSRVSSRPRSPPSGSRWTGWAGPPPSCWCSASTACPPSR